MTNEERYNAAMDKYFEVVAHLGMLQGSLIELEDLISEPAYHHIFKGPIDDLKNLKGLVEWETNPNGKYRRFPLTVEESQKDVE